MALADENKIAGSVTHRDLQRYLCTESNAKVRLWTRPSLPVTPCNPQPGHRAVGPPELPANTPSDFRYLRWQRDTTKKAVKYCSNTQATSTPQIAEFSAQTSQQPLLRTEPNPLYQHGSLWSLPLIESLWTAAYQVFIPKLPSIQGVSRTMVDHRLPCSIMSGGGIAVMLHGVSG